LATIPDYRDQTRAKLASLAPDYVYGVIGQLMIRPGFEGLKTSAITIALDALRP
jgi:hypothetical protein